MYTDYYHLKCRPFKDKQCGSAYFKSSSHQQALVNLKEALEKPDGIMVLTGANGSGKTTFLQNLKNEELKDCVSGIITNHNFSDREFLTAITLAFGLHTSEQNAREQFNVLRTFLVEQSTRQKPILIIDDAQHLSQNCFDFINMLFRYVADDGGSIHVILIGNDDLNDKLTQLENNTLRQHIIMTYDLLPLQITEAKAYVRYRLQSSGWFDDPVIEEEVYSEIYQQAGGIFSEINRYFDSLLVLGFLNESHRLSKGDVAQLTPEKLEKIAQFEQKKREEVAQKTKTNNNTSPVNQRLDLESLNIDVDLRRWKKQFYNKPILLISVVVCVLLLISLIAYDQYFKKPGELATVSRESIPMKSLQDGNIQKPSSEFKHSKKIAASQSLKTLHEKEAESGKLSLKSQSTQTNSQQKSAAEHLDTILSNIKKPGQVASNSSVKTDNARGSGEIKHQTSHRKDEVSTEKTKISQELASETPPKISIVQLPGGKTSQRAPIQTEILATPNLTGKPSPKDETTQTAALPKENYIGPPPYKAPPTENAEKVETDTYRFAQDINKLNLNRLLDQFDSAYKSGDLKKIDVIFAANIASNNINDKKSMLNEYKNMFLQSENRSMRIFAVKWKIDGEEARGDGKFEAMIQQKGSSDLLKYGGTITFHVKKGGNGLKITALYYNFEHL